jgi:type II secretory ATPase GspE/PulE/Tfp pilus assembly ATPase PilB-like protein
MPYFFCWILTWLASWVKQFHLHYTQTITARDAVEKIITTALSVHASDIHIEPLEEEVRIRYRIDGLLHEHGTIEKLFSPQIISRIKIIAHTDVAEKRLPQDGKISFYTNQTQVDLRVSTFPTLWGEKIVIRILDRKQSLLSLESVGLAPELYNLIKKIVHTPQGFFLVTGPTGAGKTTTLYALLSELISSHKNIVTLEDPIEYTLCGITQSQIAPEIGFTFAKGLRALLRQDPDIIMIGEIRDTDTALVSVQAALTGHLIISTLHTSDTASVPFRLIDMGVEPFLLASLTAVLAQRLLRLLCSHCKIKRPTTEKERDFFSVHNSEISVSIFKPVGCEHCYFTGYKGRIGIFELLIISPELKNIYTQSLKKDSVYQEILNKNTYSFAQDGIFKVQQGLIDLQELQAFMGIS